MNDPLVKFFFAKKLEAALLVGAVGCLVSSFWWAFRWQGFVLLGLGQLLLVEAMARLLERQKE